MLQDLIEREQILQSHDGQIEAKGKTIQADKFIPDLSKLLLSLVDRYPQKLNDSLLGFALAASDLSQYSNPI